MNKLHTRSQSQRSNNMNNSQDLSLRSKQISPCIDIGDLPNNKPSVIIIGVTGRIGLTCLRRLSRHGQKPVIHGFCRDSSKISEQDKMRCESIVEGDAREEDDIKLALKKTKADIVIVCVGDIGQGGKTDVRTASANAIVNVMKNRKYRHVRALVISRYGVVETKPSFSEKIGSIIKKKKDLRALEDHRGQENCFLSVEDRVTIARPTVLTDRKPTGQIKVFSDQERRSHFSDRTPLDDLASWIAEEVLCGISIGGRVANLTGLS